MRISLIDLGTNSLRLFIYELTPGKTKPRKILKTKEMVRLGDNLFDTRKIDPEAFRRTLDAFKQFRKLMNEHEVDIVRAIATSALRDASDRQKLIDTVLQETGITLEVISGEDEARLIATGVLAAHTFEKSPVLLVDIGGGSTELSAYADGKIQSSLSLQLGAARGQQLFLKTVPPCSSGEGIDRFRDYIRATLREHCSNFPADPYQLAVGSSGSIRALARVYKNRKTGEGVIFPTSFTTDFIDRVRSLSREEILKIPYMEEKRADLILSATLILNEVLLYFQIPETLATGVSLKDGLLLSIIESLQNDPEIQVSTL